MKTRNQLRNCAKSETGNQQTAVQNLDETSLKLSSSKQTSSNTSASNTDNPKNVTPKSILLKETTKISEEKTFKIIVGVTGSVATIKLTELIQTIKSKFPRFYINKLGKHIVTSIDIKILMTENSKHFAPKEELLKNLKDKIITIHDDEDEWVSWKKIGDPVLHIELRKWADLCLIAPLDANTMAKLSNGICDNLLTCVVRAWDCSKPLVYCPAMNVHMYDHPITREQLCKLQSFGYLRVDSVQKRLACGDFGMGAMASTDSIANKVVNCLLEPVIQKIPLSKPLLNQHPTYPIISTSDDCSSKPTHLTVNGFKTDCRITVRSLPETNANSYNSTRFFEDPSSNSLLDVAPELKRFRNLGDNPFPNCTDQKKLHVTKNYSKVNGNSKPNRVTSLLNLKAIDGGKCSSIDTDSNYIDDDYGLDLDPSRLLEQSMITDDSSNLDLTRANEIGEDSNCGSSFERDTLKLSGTTPLFNTSKFLALCYDKARNCFNCTICKNDYKNRKSMARHLKEQHVQGNIYHCALCGVSYKRREKLIKHNREKHLH